eukprot:snap_masked-scaffold_3-processed-gene-9.20-mRNA-1 protein AED:0.20 eAED:1.00 QI:0/-1/0/1/-1/1/1/0/291
MKTKLPSHLKSFMHSIGYPVIGRGRHCLKLSSKLNGTYMAVSGLEFTLLQDSNKTKFDFEVSLSQKFLKLLNREEYFFKARNKHILEKRVLDVDFQLSTNVFQPKTSTFALVETVLALNLPPNCCIMDIGCGSGCLGIWLNKKKPDSVILSVDINPNAVALTRRNVSKNKCRSIEVVQCDVFAFGFLLDRVDLLMCNPPYLSISKAKLYSKTVHEPHEAVLSDSLLFYRKLSRLFKVSSAPFLVVEVPGNNEKIANKVVHIFLEILNLNVSIGVPDFKGMKRCLVFEKISY